MCSLSCQHRMFIFEQYLRDTTTNGKFNRKTEAEALEYWYSTEKVHIPSHKGIVKSSYSNDSFTYNRERKLTLNNSWNINSPLINVKKAYKFNKTGFKGYSAPFIICKQRRQSEKCDASSRRKKINILTCYIWPLNILSILSEY